MSNQKPSENYLHGFTPTEQQRLRVQARLLEFLIYQDINFSGVKNLIEVGCGVGAQSEILLRRFPDLSLQGVSTHAYSHSAGIQIRHAIVERNIEGLKNYLSIYRMKTDWEIHFMCSLDYVERNGGVAHLYFHSWEIEKEDQWEKLERVLCYAAQKTSLKRILNKELYDFSHIQNQNESYA